MDGFITVIINGLSEGSLIFMTAIGLSIILGLMGIVNFAHGTLFLWGAYIFAWIFGMTNNFILAILASIVIGFLLGVIFEKLFISRVYGNTSAQIMITLGIQIVFTELARVFWGAKQITVQRPNLLNGVSQYMGVTLVHYRIFLIVFGVLLAIVGHLILTKTKIGMIVRAGVQNSEMVDALGINVNRIFTVVFATGAALAGLAGAFYGPLTGSVTSYIGANNQLLAFIVIVIGGVGNYLGNAFGSLFLGLTVAIVAWFLPSLSLVVPVLIMALVLIFKPDGLFSKGKK